MKILIAAAALSFGTGAAAQGMYKCKDAAGKITYAGNECHLLGLMPAGEVSGRASVAPGEKFTNQQRAAPAVQPAPAASPPPPAAVQGADAGDKSTDGDKRCFTRQVKTAKGFATVRNCNDKPDEETTTQ
jgi:hypothetical protein